MSNKKPHKLWGFGLGDGERGIRSFGIDDAAQTIAPKYSIYNKTNLSLVLIFFHRLVKGDV